jgi:short subunit dehydrogenase-like uncharacterized protein
MVSGGTLQSMAEIVGSESPREITDPAALIGDPALAEEVRRVSPIAVGPRTSSDGDAIAPMLPAAYINPAVVLRTAELFAAERGTSMHPFRYREGVAIPGGPGSLPFRYAAAAALGGMQSGIGALVRARPAVRGRIADLMRRTLPSSGFGPQGERLEEWSWSLAVEARTTGSHHVRVEVDADGHPGYLTTATMLGEAGLMLATEGVTPERAGCLTPAIALGTQSIDRFERAGMRFAVTS